MEKLSKEQKENVRMILANDLCLSPEDVKDSSNLLNDLGADSLDIIGIIVLLEVEFECTIPDEVVESVKTVEDVFLALEKSLFKA